MMAVQNQTKSTSRHLGDHATTSYVSKSPFKRAYQIETIEHRFNDTKPDNNIESINTSSVSSSGYNSHNGTHNNYNNHIYASQQHQYQIRARQSGMGADLSSSINEFESLHGMPRTNKTGHQYCRPQLTAVRTPMVPMMIDDELDVDGVDVDLIDDDIEEDNNNISGFHSSHPNSHYHSLHHHHAHTGDCVDSDTAEGCHQQEERRPTDRDIYLEAQQNSETSANYAISILPKLHHVMPAARQQIDQRLVYNSNSFALAAYNNGNNNSGSNNTNTNRPAAVYHQPNLAQYQQYHSFSYHHLDPVQSQYSNQPNSLTSSIENKGHQSRDFVQLHTNNSINNKRLMEKSNQSNNVSSGNKSATGALIKFNQGSSNKVNKMQGSRQQLTSPPDQQYHRQQQQQHQYHHSSSSKRKSGAPTSSSRKHTHSKSISVMASAKPALGWCGKLAKLSLFITNILFWSSGIALGAWGILSLVDDHKYNVSQLLVFEPNSKMSLFQLLSWSFITLGCATVLVGFCGCSAIFKNNRWILGLYIFLILAIFALDLATGLLAIIFQERLVANVRLRLVNKLRSEYGVQASFTAAIDYIQTKYECCGLEGHFDYDQSLWRLQRLGGFEATVARTCCHLRNTFDDQAHINPRPVNESMCQSTDVRFYQSYRYRKGCLDDLERLVRHKIWTFTIGCGAVAGIILLSLVFATCFCRSIPNNCSRKSSSSDREQQLNHQDKTHSGLTSITKQQKQIDAQQRHYR